MSNTRRSTRHVTTRTRPAPLQMAISHTTPLGVPRPALNSMMPDQLRAWIGSTRAALHKKMARERASLDRRATRGTHTPTDEAYEMDQVLEAGLLDMLTECERHVALMEPKEAHLMKDDTIYTLVASSNRGRYALDDPETGHDLTSGEPIAILLGGHRAPGHIEHGRERYASEHLIDQRVLPGYYFIASDGAVCGLCTGMHVRLI